MMTGIFLDLGPSLNTVARVAANKNIQKPIPQMPVTEASCTIGKKFIWE
jgi:hypothetical protein